ncbi:hypothetical protein Asera_21940 [Actinocatenispora sera]|uniref:Uncharacterized protein n=1 Tax=Actinocatenispora sera TaxID=390989 RepID=A0A810L0T2_9ACTN|nr:hypothetical protein Asera_21940 [Actinocatenispora sera]
MVDGMRGSHVDPILVDPGGRAWSSSGTREPSARRASSAATGRVFRSYARQLASHAGCSRVRSTALRDARTGVEPAWLSGSPGGARAANERTQAIPWVRA